MSAATEKSKSIDSMKTTTIADSDTKSQSIQSLGDSCMYKGQKYALDERFEDGCDSICKCMASSVDCEPRCPKLNQTAAHEQCVSVPDPKDSCCRIELCDVTLDDHEQGAIAIVPPPPSFDSMKNKNVLDSNHTSNGLHNDKELTLPLNGNKNDEKYDCEYNGSKYTIGKIKNFHILTCSLHQTNSTSQNEKPNSFQIA